MSLAIWLVMCTTCASARVDELHQILGSTLVELSANTDTHSLSIWVWCRSFLRHIPSVPSFINKLVHKEAEADARSKAAEELDPEADAGAAGVLFCSGTAPFYT